MTADRPHLHSGGGVFLGGFLPLLGDHVKPAAGETATVADDQPGDRLPCCSHSHPTSAQLAREPSAS